MFEHKKIVLSEDQKFMQRLWNLNWENITYDHDISGLMRGLIDWGVIEGGTVVGNKLQPVQAIVPLVRSNGQKILAFFESDEVIDLPTTGDYKVYIEVDQSKIDFGGNNAEDGTGIASIKTWPTVPSQNFLLLASVTGGVVRLDRTIIPKVGQLAARISQVEKKATETTTELNKLSGGSYAFNKEYYSLDALKKGEDFGFVPELSDEDYFGMVAVGSAATNKVHKIKGFLSGVDFNSIDLFLSKTLTPSHNLIISIRDYKTNALINNNARVEIQPDKIKNIKEKVTVTFPGMITNNQKWKAVVVQVETPIDNPNNYYVLYVEPNIGSTWSPIVNKFFFRNSKVEEKFESTNSETWPDFLTIKGDGNYRVLYTKELITWDFDIEREGAMQGTSYGWHAMGFFTGKDWGGIIAAFQFAYNTHTTWLWNDITNTNIENYNDHKFHIWRIKREGTTATFWVDGVQKGQMTVKNVPVYFLTKTYDNWSWIKMKWIRLGNVVVQNGFPYINSTGLVKEVVIKANAKTVWWHLFLTNNIEEMGKGVFSLYGFVDTILKWYRGMKDDGKMGNTTKKILGEWPFFYGYAKMSTYPKGYKQEISASYNETKEMQIPDDWIVIIAASTSYHAVSVSIDDITYITVYNPNNSGSISEKYSVPVKKGQVVKCTSNYYGGSSATFIVI